MYLNKDFLMLVDRGIETEDTPCMTLGMPQDVW